MTKVYNLPKSILVIPSEKLIKFTVLDWLSRNVGEFVWEDDKKPISRGRGWRIDFNTTRKNLTSSTKLLPYIEFDDTVDESIILYFLLRFGDSE